MERVLFIKQRPFKFYAQYDIYDERDVPVYFVDTQKAWMRRQTLKDQWNRPLGTIQEKFAVFSHTYEISINDHPAGAIHCPPYFLKASLDLDYFGWHVKGDWSGWHYKIFNSENKELGSIEKHPFHLTDQFSLHYFNEDDVIALLLLVLAIDCILDQQNAA